MKHLLHAVTAVIVIGACGVSLASAQTPEAVSVPEAQRALSLVMGKMVALASTASNTSHVDYLPLEKAMCAAIPSAPVSGWVGKVVAITDLSVGDNNGFTVGTRVPNGMLLLLNIATSNSHELLLGNFYWMGVTYTTAAASPSLLFPIGSLFNGLTSSFRPGDTIGFSGSFVPFKSLQSCVLALQFGNYLSLFHFSSIRKLGSDLTLE